ncbi:hypothetical protein Micbo1qcDRAFT_165772 [Microdochium bolleyi]|uniref:Uncharacterized protein n=1 Tax=Microdochium bolleyi TaxID=196109 RepID=A0A136IVN7_9PEZI|nr:hypothetical protein Micbo1qcDRAFT_165772 [Microdochium bolleyi]
MAFDMPAAESFLRTFSPPVLGLHGEIVNTPYIFCGVLRPPPRTPLAASSLSSLRAPREVYASQPVNGSSPTILLVDAEADAGANSSSPRGVPAAHFPYNNSAHAVALYWQLLQDLQQALAKSATSTPVDPVAIFRQVLRDYEYRTMVLGQNRNLQADASCWVTADGQGMCFRSATGETAEAFFQRQLGPEVNVMTMSQAEVRPWAHTYHNEVAMAMDSVPVATETEVEMSAPEQLSMELDAAMLVPLTPQTTAAQPHHMHAHPVALAQQHQWFDSAMSFTSSKKRKFVDATAESCRKVARVFAKPHFRSRPASWTTA